MKYKIVTSGTAKEVTLGEISGNLRIFSEVYFIQDGEIYLGPVSHKTLVLFPTEFAHYALQNYAKKNNPEAEICISLVRKWIEDDTSVSNKFIAGDPIKYPTKVVFGLSNNSLGVPV